MSSFSRGSRVNRMTPNSGKAGTRPKVDSESHPGHLVPQNKISKFLSSVQNHTLVHAERLLNLEHGESANPSPQGPQLPLKRATPKHSNSLDSANPTSRLKRQLSECSKARRPQDATPLGNTETYEQAKLNLHSLTSSHSPNNFHPRAFTSKRATASLPYATHLVPRSILTESLPQKPAENYLFKALPRPPTGQVVRSGWTTDLGRSSSAPTRVRFADPMVHFSPTPSTPEYYDFSEFEPSRHIITRQKTEPILPKSCIKSTGKHYQVQGSHSSSTVHTDSLPPVMLCDSPLQEEFCASISFMADLIFPQEVDQDAGKEPFGGAGVGRTEHPSSKASPLLIGSDFEKEVRSRSTTDHKLGPSKPRELPVSIRQTLSGPARSALHVPAVVSKSSAPSPSPIQDSHCDQTKKEKILNPPCQLEKDSSQYANDYRENILRFTMSPKIKRIEVTSNLQGTAVQLQHGKKIGKVVRNRKLDAVANLPSQILDEHRETVIHQAQAEGTTNLGKRSFRERTDRSPTVSPLLASALALPSRRSRKESIIDSDSPDRKGHSSPKRFKDFQAVPALEPTDIIPMGTQEDLKSPRSGSISGEISPRLKNADARPSSSPSFSSEAPSTSSRTDFSPVPSPQVPETTTLHSWNDLVLNNFDDAYDPNHQSEATSPCTMEDQGGSTPCKTPFQCVIVSEPEVLLPRALEDSDYRANSFFENGSMGSLDMGSLDRQNHQHEPEPVPRELLGIFGEETEDGVVEMTEETVKTRRKDTIEAGAHQSEASVTIRPQCFCKCSKRWENWNLYLRNKEEETMKCYSESSSAGRSSISSHTDNSLLWNSAPQIAIIKPEEYLFSELKSPPIYSKGLRFSAIGTSEDCRSNNDNHYVGHAVESENKGKVGLDVDDLHEGQVRAVRSINSISESQNQLTYPFSQELQDEQHQSQASNSNCTTIIVKPPVMKKRCLTYKVLETNDLSKTPGIYRHRRDNYTGAANGKRCEARTLLPSPEITSPLRIKAIKRTSKSLSSPFARIKGSPTIMTKFELSMLKFPQTILYLVLVELTYQDFLRLTQVSRVLRVGFGLGEVKETILKVFLSELRYCDSLPFDFHAKIIDHRLRSQSTANEINSGALEYKCSSNPLLLTDNSSTNLTGRATCDLSLRKRQQDSSNPLEIDFQELHAFHELRQSGENSFLDLANHPTSHRLSNNSSIIQAYCSLHNKMVIRARLQFEDSTNPIHQSHARQFHPDVFSPGRVVVFRLWIPSVKKSMSKVELLKCEAEMLRFRSFVRKGDIFWNAALGSSGNAGRLIYDGQHLQELQDLLDPVGHLPNWLNMFLFPPSFYHHTIKSSSLNPVFYLDLTDFKEQLISSLSLVNPQESPETSESQDPSQQGMLNYLGLVDIRAGKKTGVIEGIECFRDHHDGYILQEFIHPDWVGKLMIEIQVSSIERLQQLFSKFEKSKFEDFLSMGVDPPVSSNHNRHRLLSNLKSNQLSPWRIIRQKSSPGMVWISLPIRA